MGSAKFNFSIALLISILIFSCSTKEKETITILKSCYENWRGESCTGVSYGELWLSTDTLVVLHGGQLMQVSPYRRLSKDTLGLVNDKDSVYLKVQMIETEEGAFFRSLFADGNLREWRHFKTVSEDVGSFGKGNLTTSKFRERASQEDCQCYPKSKVEHEPDTTSYELNLEPLTR